MRAQEFIEQNYSPKAIAKKWEQVYENIKAVTTYNNKLYKEYAHRFEKTYNWDFPYTVYNEDDGMLEQYQIVKFCRKK